MRSPFRPPTRSRVWHIEVQSSGERHTYRVEAPALSRAQDQIRRAERARGRVVTRWLTIDEE